MPIITIDRTNPFDLTPFLGLGSSIWKGPIDGDGLSGDEEQGKRSLALTEVDVSRIRLVTTLKEGEIRVGGEERIRRLKNSGYIRLDAKLFQFFLEHKECIPEEWKERVNGNVLYIHFDGTVFRDSNGDRRVECLCWGGAGYLGIYRRLGDDYDANDLSAVLDESVLRVA